MEFFAARNEAVVGSNEFSSNMQKMQSVGDF